MTGRSNGEEWEKKPAPLEEVVNNKTKESRGSVKQKGLAIS